MSALFAVLRIFSFQFRSAFLPCRSTRQHSGVLGLLTQYRTSDVAENLRVSCFLEQFSSGNKIANVNIFYDDIAHVLQNTKKREPTSFNKLDDS